MNRLRLRIAPLANRTCPFCKPGVNSIWTVFTYRTLPSCSDASPLEITSGNIGMTFCGRYTLVARWRASTSSAPPSFTNAATSAMWTVSTQCFVFGSMATDTASSKSFASGGSMVMTRSSVKSSRPSRSVSANWLATCRASASADSGNASGRPNARITESVSTPGWPCGPSTSVTTPSPRLSGVGNRSISTTTLSCGFAPFAPASPTAMLCVNAFPSMRTSASRSRSK